MCEQTFIMRSTEILFTALQPVAHLFS